MRGSVVVRTCTLGGRKFARLRVWVPEEPPPSFVIYPVIRGSVVSDGRTVYAEAAIDTADAQSRRVMFS